jgi:multidrug efflux pump subunit AcrA (membrane-fusion protein)
MRNVKIGRRAGDGIEILSGIEPEDRVIVENTGVLDDGVPVRAEDR